MRLHGNDAPSPVMLTAREWEKKTVWRTKRVPLAFHLWATFATRGCAAAPALRAHARDVVE